MEKRRNIFILVFILVATVSLAGLSFWFSFRIKQDTSLTESFASEVEQISEMDTKEDILSPDGKMTLTVKNVRKADIVTQTFFTASDADESPVQIYSADSGSDSVFSIPFNTFSPDNKYIFLKKGVPEKPEYIVLRTDGENIKGEEKTREITSLFYEKYSEFKITDVTGWAGIGLIVVNSDYLNGDTGPSFWFDMSNFSFIRLSTRFN